MGYKYHIQHPQEEVSTMDERLKDSIFASSYATALCNMAEILLFLENTAAALDNMNSAVKALSVSPKDARTNPVLGRALSMLAVHAMSIGHAVTAEGLFRSAIDLLGSPVR